MDANRSNFESFREGTTTPNLIARSENPNMAQPDHVVSALPYDNVRSRPVHMPFASQADTGTPAAAMRDRHHSRPIYGPSIYPSGTPQGAPPWTTIDPRYPHRLDTGMHQGQHQPAYMYTQYQIPYADPRAQYMRDPTYYPTDMPHGQPYPGQQGVFDPHQQLRYKSSTYPYIPGPTMTYEQHQGSYGLPPSPSRMQPPDFSPTHARLPFSSHGAGSGGQPVSVGAPQYAIPKGRGGYYEPTPSYPRGPPRKPKQTGNAVWVGNLNPGTIILDLKDYFSRGATKDIESVFLISKSNCAFVNYKTAESAQAAVARFHDSRFNGARLVCRLRQGQVNTNSTTVPALAIESTTLESAPPMLDGDSGTGTSQDGVHEDFPQQTPSKSTLLDGVTEQPARTRNSPTKMSLKKGRVYEKYFVVKSLTLQDLEASVRDGIWATQAHNESALKEAYESAQNVYLVFSANKSGEYFGYARMKSNINPNAITSNPRAETSAPVPADGPTSKSTPATECAPKGRVVDDSARGTIFWEADSTSESEGEVDGEPETDGVERSDNDQSPETSSKPRAGKRTPPEDLAKQDWGKPFEIEWLCTSRLPFYRTRGLRNPWNANREVKIARDGTELEPSVGRRLLELFHSGFQEPMSNSMPYSMSSQPMVADGSSQALDGHAHHLPRQV